MAGLEIERYELGPVIGTGAFATVYQGRDPRLNAPVAVKVLADNWSVDPSVRFRFGQEAALLRRVKNEHRDAPLVEVFDIDEATGGRPYFVMTYADRGTLSDRTPPGGVLSPAAVAPIVDALGAGMAALHAGGVIHRDLKPSNLLYVTAAGASADEQLLIGDLGLAKDQLASGSALTVAGGSPGYMAPEQATGLATITTQADIYSASVIVLELLTGKKDPDALDRLSSEISTAIGRGMAMLPTDRHHSADHWSSEVSAALCNDLGNELGSERQPQPQGLRAADSSLLRRVLPLLVGAAVITALLIGVFSRFDVGRTGSGAVAVQGPQTATIGEPILLAAEVPNTGDYTWIVDGQRLADQDLRLTPRTVGRLEVRLEHLAEDGRVVTVVHVIEVQP